MKTNLLPALAGATGMAFVGGSVAVSGFLSDAPSLTVQALRYAVACLLLLLFARVVGKKIVRPRGREWLWLAGVVLTGLIIFNVALVHGSRHAEPAVIGVAVACVPLLMAVAGPLLEGRSPARRLIVAALVVTAGAALVQGLGRTDGAGLLWALVTFACEAGFTLLAVPVLGRHGPLGVSVHATWMAAAAFAVGGVVGEGPAAVLRLHLDDMLAGVYLAVAVTAVAFVLWYTCVQRIGSARAGLLTGIAPISAAVVGVALAGPMPGPAVWLGIAVVAAGLTLGFRPQPPARRSGLADGAGEARDELGGKGPRQDLQEPAGNGQALSDGGGGGPAGVSGAGLQQRGAEVQADADEFDGAARRRRSAGLAGAGKPAVVAGGPGPAEREGENQEQAEQGAPGLVAVAEQGSGDPGPDQVPAADGATVDLVVPLGHEDAPDGVVVPGGTVGAGQLLVGLGRVAGGVPTEQPQPVAQ